MRGDVIAAAMKNLPRELGDDDEQAIELPIGGSLGWKAQDGVFLTLVFSLNSGLADKVFDESAYERIEVVGSTVKIYGVRGGEDEQFAGVRAITRKNGVKK